MRKPDIRHVPSLSTYYPSRDEMDREQREFLDYFVRSWKDGSPINVQGQISYIFCYVYDVVRAGDMKIAADELGRIIDFYRTEDKIEDYCSGWRSDCYVVLKDYRSALNVFPTFAPNKRSSGQTDSLLTLKLLNNHEISGRDVLTLFGPKVTAYVRDRVDDLSVYFDAQIPEIVKHEGPILERWRLLPSVHKHEYQVFNGIPMHIAEDDAIEDGPNRFEYDAPVCFGFTYSEEIADFCTAITSQAENALREDEGIPRIGEGWIAETKLFYEIAEALSGIDVQQHAQPKWLGRQHLDIFVPELSVAIEYQGEQHDRPVDFFGGLEAFEKAKKRDARKRRLCKRHGVALIEVRQGYDLPTIISDVKAHRQLEG